MATYVNDLRLKEISTGDESGTWGTSTNTNLELIGEALGYATEQSFSSDADATTTVADGVSDPARAMYFKVTSAVSLTATRTLTIAPNTVSRVMFIENATSGSQSIAISQGSGANVTIATGKTAIVYLDGAGSGAAVVDAMAGVDPGVTDTLAEVLTAGNTTGGTDISVSSGDDITFADSSKAIFGAGSDLQIYHDGSTSIIKDAGTGELQLHAENNLRLQNLTGSTYALFSNGAAASLYYNGSAKLATTSTGIDVTGNVTLESSDAGAGEGPEIFLHRNSASPAASDVIGVINFDGENSAGSQHTYGKIKGVIVDPTNTSEDGKLVFQARGAGAGFSDIMTVASTGIDVTGTVTADGLTVDGNSQFDVGAGTATFSIADNGYIKVTHPTRGGDYRLETNGSSAEHFDIENGTEKLARFSANGDVSLYEDTGTTAKFFWDSSAESLGIGDTTPSFNLDVAGDARVANGFTANGGAVFNENSSDVDFRVESNGSTHALFVDASANNVGIGDSAPLGKLTVFANSGGGGGTVVPTSITVGDSDSGNAWPGDGTLSTVFNYYSGDGSNQGVRYRHGVGETASSGTTSKWALQYRAAGGAINSYTGFADAITAYSGAVVINEDGGDNDFRVESDGNTHMLFVNAGANRVGIGESDPQYTLHATSSGTTLTRLESTDAGAAYGPYLDLRRTSASPIDGDGLGIIVFTGQDSGANGTTYAQIRAEASDVTDGTEDGLLSIRTIRSGTDTARININSDATVLNEGSADVDFRVESNSNANMLFVDAGNDHVCIGTATDFGGVLNVNGGAVFDDATTFDPDTLGTGRIAIGQINDGGGFAAPGIAWGGSNGQNAAIVSTAGILYLGTGNQASPDTVETGIEIQRNEITVNNNSLDTDFRVESDTNTHMLFVDASTNRIGMNDSAPASTLSIISDEAQLIIGGTTGGNARGLKISTDSTGYQSNDTVILDAQNAASGEFLIKTQSVERLSLSATEAVFNDTGVDTDFRVESNGNANMLFVDAGANRVVVGSNSGLVTNEKFAVRSTGGTENAATFYHATTDDRDLVILMHAGAVGATTRKYLSFLNYNGISAGSVTVNETATAYNTSSDARLKENIADAGDAGVKVDAIQVRQFDWKADGSHQDYGMVAQELVEVAPEAVTGDPDGEEMMGVDYSKLVPMLIKEIQSLRARVAQLENT